MAASFPVGDARSMARESTKQPRSLGGEEDRPAMCNIHIARATIARAQRRCPTADALDDALLREIAGKGGDQALSGAGRS